jgi:hypothetical protein
LDAENLAPRTVLISAIEVSFECDDGSTDLRLVRPELVVRPNERVAVGVMKGICSDHDGSIATSVVRMELAGC